MAEESKNLVELIRAQPLFSGLTKEASEELAACALTQCFAAGRYLAHEGDPADFFYVVLSGTVAIETRRAGLGPATLQTLHPGDVVGWSWLFPDAFWTFDAHALEETRALTLDGRAVRRTLEADPRLGFVLIRRFADVIAGRLRAARLQLLDLYGHAKQ